jgi:hypothetical protein
MARTTTTTKAKTKTKKATTRTAAARSRKTTAVSAKAKQPTITTKKQRDVIGQLRRLHFINFLSAVVLAIAAGLLMQPKTFQLLVGHFGRDALSSQTHTVFAPAYEAVYDIEVRWVLVAVLGITALFSLLLLTRLARQYSVGLENRLSKWRWIEGAITSALIIELIAVVSGVADLPTLKVLGGIMVVTAALGWIAERENAGNAGRPVKGAFFTSILSGLLPWLLIAWYAVASTLYGAVRYPWYVYALYAAVVIGWVLMTVNQWFGYKLRKAWGDYRVVERNAGAVGIVTKVAFAVILIIGLQR